MVDMSYGQLAGYPLTTTSPPIATTEMSSTVTSVTSPRACCENGRPIMTDPHTGQTICSCQYGTALLNYSRVQGLPDGVYGASAAAYAAGAAQGYVPLVSEGSAFYTPLGKPAFDIKDGSAEAWRTLAAQSGGCFPYDPAMAIYPYGTGYGGLDLNARRKNATRETTNTLKAWLYEHRKNPYPTKGEKIMLAIITKMTLTQVSTWFANARRRLKKENKMTWSPRNRSEDGDADMDDNDDDLDDHNKENANDSSNSHDSALNMSMEDNDLTRPSADVRRERIINVDADDSDHSDVGGLDDTDDAEDSRVKVTATADIPSPGSAYSDSRGSHVDSKSPRLSGETTSTSSSETDSQTRPKIWSVSDLVASSNSNKECSSSKLTNSPAVVCSRQTNGPPFLNFQQHASQGVRNGQFPMGIAGYPLSLTHTTLSYPYTLTSSTATKSELSMHHAAALRASEQALKEGLMEKAARIQHGIFSPGREIDGVKVGGKMIL